VRNRLGTERDGDDPRPAPELAVRDDVEPGRLLERDRFAHRAILDDVELGDVERAVARGFARLAQVVRTQQAPDDVGARHHHRASPAP